MGFSEIGQRPLKPETHLSNAMMTQSAPHTVGWSKRLLQSWRLLSAPWWWKNDYIQLGRTSESPTNRLESLLNFIVLVYHGLPVGLQQIPKNQKKTGTIIPLSPSLALAHELSTSQPSIFLIADSAQITCSGWAHSHQPTSHIDQPTREVEEGNHYSTSILHEAKFIKSPNSEQ